MTQNKKLRSLIIGLFVLVVAGCTLHEEKLYEGKAVDEQGSPVQNVSIILCYVGWKWDWSMAGGFPLVMGHPFCSDPVMTDQFGNYKVLFAGPPSTYILARHPDWIQTKSFLAKDNRVVLVRQVVDSQRRRKQEEEKEKAFRKLKVNESAIEYYCRVVLNRSGTLDLNYHGQRIKIVQALLVSGGEAIFALVGPYDVAQSLANDLIIHEMVSNGIQGSLDSFEALQQSVTCGNNMYFINSTSLDRPSAVENAGRAKIEIPSVRGVFTTKVWRVQ